MSDSQLSSGASAPIGPDGDDVAAGDKHRHGVPHAHPIQDVTGFELDEGVSTPSFRARWHPFVPVLAIAIIYAAGWFYLVSEGRSDDATTRLLFIVLAVGVPLLAAHAFLRYQTVRVQVLADAVRYHPGWPRDMPVDMPLDLIDRVRVKRGLSGRLFGGGTLVMDLTTGERASVADLDNPKGAFEAIEQRLAQRRDDTPPVGALEF